MRDTSELGHSTTTTCPCCGRDMRTAQFVIDQRRNWAKARGAVAKMSPQETDIAFYLWKSATPRTLAEVALHSNGFTVDPGEIKKAKGVAKVVIFRLRQKLKPLGVAIESDMRRGYWLNVGGANDHKS